MRDGGVWVVVERRELGGPGCEGWGERVEMMDGGGGGGGGEVEVVARMY